MEGYLQSDQGVTCVTFTSYISHQWDGRMSYQGAERQSPRWQWAVGSILLQAKTVWVFTLFGSLWDIFWHLLSGDPALWHPQTCHLNLLSSLGQRQCHTAKKWPLLQGSEWASRISTPWPFEEAAT